MRPVRNILQPLQCFMLIILNSLQGPPRKFLWIDSAAYRAYELLFRYDVLPYAIDLLKSRGYQLVTVAECLNMDPYLSRGEPETVCIVSISIFLVAPLTLRCVSMYRVRGAVKTMVA